MTSISKPQPGSGGFLQPILPSPTTSTAVNTSNTVSTLPQPRSSPLRPGSSKESNLIDYVDTKLLGISRRYEKRHSTIFEDDVASDIEGRGYESFGAMAQDLEKVMEVVWISGTRKKQRSSCSSTYTDQMYAYKASLQTPYLMTIALNTCSCLPSFPFEPRPTFHLLRKLDLAFYSLLQGTNAETGKTLPGFEGGQGKLNTTEKVRMRGLVERTRVAVVEAAGKWGNTTDAKSLAQTDTEDESTMNDDEDDDEEMQVAGNYGRWEMEIARVFEKTIVELGMSLDNSGGFG